MIGTGSLLRCTAYRAAVFWLMTENTKPLPIPMLMSWPPSGVSNTTRGSPPYLSRLPWLPRAYSLLSRAWRLSPISSAPSSPSGLAGSWRPVQPLFLLGAHSTLLTTDLLRSLRTLFRGITVGSVTSIIRCPFSAAESTNLSPA
jgi:hypothetical protein